MSIAPIKGLFETHLTVWTLGVRSHFTKRLSVYPLPTKFLKRGRTDQSMFGLWSIHSSPQRMRLHIAFDVI